MDLGRTHSCLFLDRDGVINRHPESRYVMAWEDFYFLPGVLEALVRLRDHFDHFVVITNQQGVSKGLMTEDELKTIHEKMVQAVTAFGGQLDMVCYCTDLADKQDNCRKPAPMMGYRAKEKITDIDFSRSMMIGDQLSDIMFGANLGMSSILINNPRHPVSLSPEYQNIPVFDSLWAFSISDAY